MFEITHLKKRVTGHLSAGESTRLHLCKALLNDPGLLMLDEPTASLDPDIADKVRKILRRVQQESGIAILYTSHNMRDIEEVCDRVLFMHKGKVVTEGSPQEVIGPLQADEHGGRVHPHRARRGYRECGMRGVRSGECGVGSGESALCIAQHGLARGDEWLLVRVKRRLQTSATLRHIPHSALNTPHFSCFVLTAGSVRMICARSATGRGSSSWAGHGGFCRASR